MKLRVPRPDRATYPHRNPGENRLAVLVENVARRAGDEIQLAGDSTALPRRRQENEQARFRPDDLIEDARLHGAQKLRRRLAFNAEIEHPNFIIR